MNLVGVGMAFVFIHSPGGYQRIEVSNVFHSPGFHTNIISSTVLNEKA